jgi:hypothetical protein
VNGRKWFARAEIRLIWWRSSGAQRVQGVSGFCACLTEVRSQLLRHVQKDVPYLLAELAERAPRLAPGMIVIDSSTSSGDLSAAWRPACDYG